MRTCLLPSDLNKCFSEEVCFEACIFNNMLKNPISKPLLPSRHNCWPYQWPSSKSGQNLKKPHAPLANYWPKLVCVRVCVSLSKNWTFIKSMSLAVSYHLTGLICLNISMKFECCPLSLFNSFSTLTKLYFSSNFSKSKLHYADKLTLIELDWCQ